MSASQLSTPSAPAPGVAWGIVGSLVPAAVVLVVAVVLNWGR